MSFKYRKIADSYIADIRRGSLRDGQRLPSIRALSAQHGISMTTAIKCYELMEAGGFLMAHPQSGFFVRRRETGLHEPALPAFNPRAKTIDRLALLREIQRSAQDPRRVPFGTVMLAPGLLPLESLQRSLVRSTRRATSAAGRYGSADGDPALLDALSEHFSGDGIHLRPADVLITNGGMAAIGLAVHAVTNPGDCIAIPSPCFSGQLQLLASLGRKVMEIPSSATGFDIDALEESFASGQAQAALVTASFQNPLGYCLPAGEKARIAGLASRYHVAIIEDDVFAECGHSGKHPLPIKCWDEGDRVLWCGSVSKTLAPGYRIGWCAPGRYGDAMRSLQLAEVLAVNSPLQLALADFIHSGEYRRHLKRLRIALGGQVDALREALGRCFPATSRIGRPLGGYAVWVQLPGGCDGLRVYASAKENGINIVPGAVFSTRDLYRNYIRLNAGNPWSSGLQSAVERLSTLLVPARP